MIICRLRDGLYFRWLTVFVALIFVNGIVDSPELYTDVVTEDPSYNEIESVLEMLVECVLEYEDFFKEYDENDDAEKSVLKKRASLDTFMLSSSPSLALTDDGFRNELIPRQLLRATEIWQDPLTPPPDGQA